MVNSSQGVNTFWPIISNKNQIVIEPSRNSRIIFLTILIDWAKISTDRKYWFSNFHLENSRTWIFTLWNHILQTQTSLLQPILVYTYIYNKLFSTSCCPRVWPQAFYFSIIGKSYFTLSLSLSLSLSLYIYIYIYTKPKNTLE